jgi:RNA-directed DNA polymerase
LSEGLTSAERVRDFQRKLYCKAKAEPGYRFYTLYDKTCREDVLAEAYRRVKANGGSPGVDGVTFETIERYGAERYLTELREVLLRKEYRPEPVQRVYIPKPNGGERPLGIPVIRDRIVQMSFKLVIEPIFEADFCERSYGFRPQRGAHEAIGEIKKLLNWGCTEIYDVDISKYFDTVDHQKLMQMIARRIVDKWILKVLKQWLSCGYVEDGRQHGTTQGTPQGGVISPLLANIYLHPLDKAMESSKLWWRDKGSVHMVRYADDFVVMARHGIEQGKAIVERYLQWAGLTVNEAKSGRYNLREGGELHYLGFSFRQVVSRRNGSKFFLLTPSKKSLLRLYEKVRGLLSHRRPVKLREQVQEVNTLLRGWVEYYKIGNSWQSYNKVKHFVSQRIRRIVQRRQGRRGYGYKRITSGYLYGKLGLFYNYRTVRV